MNTRLEPSPKRGMGVGKSLRTYVIKYANKYGVTDGEIRDGKVINFIGKASMHGTEFLSRTHRFLAKQVALEKTDE